jgi:hypothetical protein
VLKLAQCFVLRDAILGLDDRVRYFGVLDNRQGMIVSELRTKEENHPGEDQLVRDLTFFKGAMASWAIYFGRVKYSVVSHDRFKIFMVPIEGGLVIATTESSMPVSFAEQLAITVQDKLNPRQTLV